MWESKSCKKADESYPKVLRTLKTAPDILYYVRDISILVESTVFSFWEREMFPSVICVLPVKLEKSLRKDEIYPKSNKKLAEQIVAGGGCLISEYPSGTKPQRYTFVQSDRLQAMISK